MRPHFIHQGQGMPLIFQHGLGANVLQIQKLFGDLSNVQLVSLDCPGHGQSPYPIGDDPSFEYYANQVIDLANHLGIEKFIMGGLSMGAGISLNLALRFPERVRALVLLRPAWLDSASPDNLKILLEAARLMHTENGQQVFSTSQPFLAIQKTLPAAAASIMGVFDSNQQPSINVVLERLVKDRPFDHLAKLKDIQAPTLIIANDDDPLHPFHTAEVIHEHLPNSSLHQVTSRYIDDETHRSTVRRLVEDFISDEGF